MQHPSPSDDEDGYDVLVLGAGIAGLRAAALLAVAGERVAVIEARDRIGGRILTRHVPMPAGAVGSRPGAATSMPVELGAEFIHGLPEQSWRLVREAGLATDELAGSALRFADGALGIAQNQSGVWDMLDDLTRTIAEHPGSDQTFERYLQRGRWDQAAQNAAIRYVEGFNAADHRRIGVAALARQQRAEDSIAADRIFHVRDGYDSVPRHLLQTLVAAGGRSFLERPVAEVRWTRGAVTFSGRDPCGNEFEFRGKRAVITLPVGVLQSGSVFFRPEPRVPLDAARRMVMGSALRIPMTFRTSFWRERATLERFPGLTKDLERLGFLLIDDVQPVTWWTPYPDETPMITAWAAGPSVQGLEGRPDDVAADDRGVRLMRRWLGTLAGVFGMAAEQLLCELTSWHFHDWDADEYARGAYSYMPSGALDASERMNAPVAETLWFAGEHATTSGHWGTVHGALESGDAAAAGVLAASARRCPT